MKTTGSSNFGMRNVPSPSYENDPESSDYLDYDEYLRSFLTENHSTFFKDVNGNSLKQNEITTTLKRRFLLSARPQVGKTGVYIYVIKELERRYQRVQDKDIYEIYRLIHSWKRLPHRELALKPYEEWEEFHQKLQDANLDSPIHYEQFLQYLHHGENLNEPFRVLDMGAGQDGFRNFLREIKGEHFMNWDENYIAIDIHRPKNANPNNFLIGDMSDALVILKDNGKADWKFDFIFLCNSLYDMDSYVDHLSAAGALLKPKGLLIISFPESVKKIGFHPRNIKRSGLALKHLGNDNYEFGRSYYFVSRFERKDGSGNVQRPLSPLTLSDAPET